MPHLYSLELRIMKIKDIFFSFFILFVSLLGLASCDSDTGSMGISTTPTSDSLTIRTAIYQATSRSVLVDSVLGKTGTVYFGRYTDPETKSLFTSDFITQFNCVEGGSVFPPADSIKGDSAQRLELRLFFTSHYGADDNAMQLEVYPLERTLVEGTPYYTNLNPADYLADGAEPIARKAYTALDYALGDDVLSDEDHYHNVCIPLPTQMGTDIIRDYRLHPEHFAGATSFIENVCKGFYVKCTGGDGTVLCIDHVSLNVSFNMARTDSTYTTQFMGSQEVLQVNSFDNQGLEPLVNDNTCSWLKTPAGIFTEVTLPIDEITRNEQDTINSARIVFQKYNNDETDGVPLDAPIRLLLIRKSEAHDFFEQNHVPDGLTSFLNTIQDAKKNNYLTKYNQYAFDNIARLIVTCRNERDAWTGNEDFEATHPDWNKVLLIPVTVTTDNAGSIITLRHDFSLSSARLRGGTDPIEIRIITSAFK